MVVESVKSYYENIVRKIKSLDLLKEKITKSNTPSVRDIREIEESARELMDSASDLLKLIELLGRPEIHDFYTQTVFAWPFLTKRINCRKCKKCKKNPEEHRHGPYLYRINEEEKWIYLGRVDDYLISDFLLEIHSKNLNPRGPPQREEPGGRE